MKKVISKIATTHRFAATGDDMQPESTDTAVLASLNGSRTALPAAAGDARFEALKARLRHMVGTQTIRRWS